MEQVPFETQFPVCPARETDVAEICISADHSPIRVRLRDHCPREQIPFELEAKLEPQGIADVEVYPSLVTGTRGQSPAV